MDETFEAALAGRDGVFRSADVARWLTTAEIRAEVLAGQWRMPCRGVYLAHNGEPSPAQLRQIALASAPPGSALAGLTAAELDGLKGFGTPTVHVAVPAGGRRPRHDGLVCHLSTRLGAIDVHPARRPRRTRLPRSLVDAASWEVHDRRARAIILAGVQQRLVRPDGLRDALGRRGLCRRHALIVETIADAEGGIASVPESDFTAIVRRFLLPEPTRQAIVERSDGRYYLDAEWRRYHVSCEIHGIQHLEIPTWDTDLDRHNDLTAGGRRVLQFSSHAVRHDQTRVAQLVAKALRTGGWQGKR